MRAMTKTILCRSAFIAVLLLCVVGMAAAASDGEKCNLFIQGVLNPNAGAVFANEPNTLTISLVKNNVGNSPATEILVTSSDGWSGRAPVTAMGPTGSQSVSIVDPTVRTNEGKVTYTYKIDPDNVVPETDETTNQEKTTIKDVKFNGYKGNKYWTGKEDIKTYRTFDIHGGVVHSFGDSKYRSGSFGNGWTTFDVKYTAADLPVPAGATVKDVRLYVPYTWDNSNEANNVIIKLNGIVVPREHWEKDVSNFGAYADHWYGLMTYDVTNEFVANGMNTATLTRTNNLAKLSPAGLTLLVVYEDPAASRKQIFINEGWDLLGADVNGYGTTEEEATSYQEFSGMTIDMASAKNAMLTTFVPWGAGQDQSRQGEGNLFVNGQKVASDVWDYGEEVTGESDSPQVAVDTRDILPHLTASGTGNVIGIQSTAGSTPSMVAERAILVVDSAVGSPTTTGPTPTPTGGSTAGLAADFVANATAGPAPLAVQFTDSSTGEVIAWAWDLNNDGTIDSTKQNPSAVYADDGIFTVNLTVTGPNGTDSEVKPGYITVGNATPTPTTTTTTPTTTIVPTTTTTTAPTNGTSGGAGFTAEPVLSPKGNAVKFTVTPAAGKTVQAAWWSFDAPDHLETWNSRNINPTFFYPRAGCFSPLVRLTYTDGTTEEVHRVGYITAAGTALSVPTAAAANFTAVPYAESMGNSARFTLTQTAGKTIQEVWWSFDAPDHLQDWNSWEINPAFFYPQKGTFSPYVKITYTDGTVEEVHRVGYITVA